MFRIRTLMLMVEELFVEIGNCLQKIGIGEAGNYILELEFHIIHERKDKNDLSRPRGVDFPLEKLSGEKHETV